MRPGAARLTAAMEATWPAARKLACGTFTLREGLGGGQRVSAATCDMAPGEAEIDAAIAGMRALGQAPVFQIREGDGALDASLAARGWREHDRVALYLAPVAALAAEPPRRVSTFAIWPPLAIQRDLWEDGGIGAARQAVMARASEPKTAILGRSRDRPAGVAFVAVSDGIAMLHALHVPQALRRQGTARNVLNAAAGWAQAQGADWLALAVTVANAPANALYASLGMEVAGHYHYRIEREFNDE